MLGKWEREWRNEYKTRESTGQIDCYSCCKVMARGTRREQEAVGDEVEGSEVEESKTSEKWRECRFMEWYFSPGRWRCQLGELLPHRTKRGSANQKGFGSHVAEGLFWHYNRSLTFDSINLASLNTEVYLRNILTLLSTHTCSNDGNSESMRWRAMKGHS